MPTRFQPRRAAQQARRLRYLLHIVRPLKSTGRPASCPSVLFRGNVEADIRRNLIRQGKDQRIIGLCRSICFYGNGHSRLYRGRGQTEARTRKGIFMIDASAGFMKDGPKNASAPRTFISDRMCSTNTSTCRNTPAW
ncbi:MAG: N-6 DNA methylase [Nitrospira sp.]|nr:N-6 DNA methylase [Nitrospira sp.]